MCSLMALLSVCSITASEWDIQQKVSKGGDEGNTFLLMFDQWSGSFKNNLVYRGEKNYCILRISS